MDNSKTEAVYHGFRSWAHWLRFVSLVLVLAILTSVLIYIILVCLPKGSEAKIEGSGFGIWIVKRGDKIERATFLMPANKPWLNTGLILENGDTVSISASGNINLAFHRLVEAADVDKLPRHGWIGPEGDTEVATHKSPIDIKRKGLRIFPKANMGKLLAYLQPIKDDSPLLYPPDTSDISVIGDLGEVHNASGEQCVLWLGINEIVLQNNPTCSSLYVTDSLTLDSTYGYDTTLTCVNGRCTTKIEPKLTVDIMNERWHYIVENSYWHIWYDDNIGHFLVRIEYL